MFEKLFGLDKPEPPEENISLLTTVHDNIELAIIRSLLDGEKIPYMIKERESAVKIIMGSPMIGADIFVPTELLDTAADLIAPPDGELIEELPEEIPEDENNTEV